MAPKKASTPAKTHEQVDVTEEDEEEIARLFEMLTMEDVQSKMSGSSTDTLQGYMSAVEKKMKNYLNAYKQVKDTMKEREMKERAEERKRKTAEGKKTKKDEAMERRMKPVTINIRFGLSGQLFSLTVPLTTTMGEFRRLILAHFNTLNPMDKIPKAKAGEMQVFMGEVAIHTSPRKTLEYLNITNDCVLVVLMGGNATAVDEEVESNINEETEEDIISGDDLNESDEQQEKRFRPSTLKARHRR